MATAEGKMGITTIRRDKVLVMCPLFERLDCFMSNRVSSNPPYLGDNLDTVSDNVFNRHPTADDEEEGQFSPSVTNTEVHDDRDEVHAAGRPSTPMQTTGTHRTSTAPSSDKKRSKKAKGMSEAILTLGEHSRKLGEQKLAMRAEWQTKQFELLHRKLDLEEQQLSLRKLELQVQLEALRGNRKERSIDCDEPLEGSQ